MTEIVENCADNRRGGTVNRKHHLSCFHAYEKQEVRAFG